MRSLPRFARILAALVALGTASVHGASIEAFLTQFAYYPVHFDDNPELPYSLTVTVGGKRQRLLVDTGCPITTMDPKNVPGAKTLGELHRTLKDSLMGTIDDPRVMVVPALTIAKATFTNQPALPHALETDYSPMYEDGYLGLDFMMRQHCVIDCAGQEIFFRGAKRTGEQQAGFEASLTKSGFVPVRCKGDYRIILDSTVGGTREQWLVDTGSAFTALEETERLRLKLPLTRDHPTGSFLPTSHEGLAIGLKGIGLGVNHMKLAEMPEMKVGAITWPSDYVGSADYDVNVIQDHPKLTDLHGIIGQPFLAKHGALIDVENRTIWFAPGR